jgi:putative peptidoglycan lipid II flippase
MQTLEDARLPTRRELWELRIRDLLVRDFSVAEATVILMTSFALSAVLGSIQQVLFNAQFGAGAEASAFYAALRLRDLFYSVLAGRALASALIPVLTSVTREGGHQAQLRLVNLVMSSLLVGLTILVAACELAAPLIVTNVLAPGFDRQTSELTVDLIRLVLLQPLILSFACVATAYLNSRHRFLLASLSIASHNVGLIAGIVATWIDPALGMTGPALGVLLGAVLQILVLWPELRASGLRWRPAWQPNDPHLRDVGRLLIPTSASVGVGYGGLVLDTAFASMALEPAALPALYNAWLLITLPLSMIGKAVGQSAFPRFAESAVAGDRPRLRRMLLKALAVSAGLALPALVGLVVFGRLIIRVLFEHGRFDASAGVLTFQVLEIYSIGLPAYIGAEVVIRGLIAVRDTRTPLLGDLAQLLARGLCMAALIGPVGVLAVPIAFASTSVIELAILGSVLWFHVHRGRFGHERFS